MHKQCLVTRLYNALTCHDVVLDLMVWRPEVICCKSPLFKDIEEITLTGFTTWVSNTRLIYSRVVTDSHIAPLHTFGIQILGLGTLF
jgi:hypothetical protein